MGKPDSGGLAREAHIVAHCIRKEEDHSYAELVDRLSLMPGVCDRLEISSDASPDPTTFYHLFDRYEMYIWRALLRVSALQSIEESAEVQKWYKQCYAYFSDVKRAWNRLFHPDELDKMNLSELQSEMSLLEVQISRHATKGETLDADQKLINKLDKLSEACRKPSAKGLHHNIILLC